MANSKISALTAATTPLAGTEVLPIVQSSATVKVATNDLTVRNVRANATTGILQVTGPTAGTTRVMTTPDANFTSARTDTGQTFTGAQNLENGTGTNQRLLYLKQANDYGYAFNIDSNTTGKLFLKTVNAGVESNFLTFDRSTYDFTVNTGNIIQGTAAKGVNFTANTPAAGMTSQLLNWYETGTFTPAMTSGTGGPIVLSTATGQYTRIGNIVNFRLRVTVSNANAAGGAIAITGLPFTSSSTIANRTRVIAADVSNVTGSTMDSIGGSFVPNATTQINILTSLFGNIVLTNTSSMDFNGTYFV